MLNHERQIQRLPGAQLVDKTEQPFLFNQRLIERGLEPFQWRDVECLVRRHDIREQPIGKGVLIAHETEHVLSEAGEMRLIEPLPGMRDDFLDAGRTVGDEQRAHADGRLRQSRRSDPLAIGGKSRLLIVTAKRHADGFHVVGRVHRSVGRGRRDGRSWNTGESPPCALVGRLCYELSVTAKPLKQRRICAIGRRRDSGAIGCGSQRLRQDRQSRVVRERFESLRARRRHDLTQLVLKRVFEHLHLRGAIGRRRR